MKKIVAIYLAAGQSRRFGKGNKLFAIIDNHPLGTIALKEVVNSRVNETIVVATAQHADFWQALEEIVHLTFVRSGNGQSASLKAGLRIAEMLHADAVMVVLADQPNITTQLLDNLIALYDKNDKVSFIAYHVGGIIAPPLLINKQLFSCIHQLEGDGGAKHIIKAERDKGLVIEMDHSESFKDIDTFEDYQELLEMRKADKSRSNRII